MGGWENLLEELSHWDERNEDMFLKPVETLKKKFMMLWTMNHNMLMWRGLGFPMVLCIDEECVVTVGPVSTSGRTVVFLALRCTVVLNVGIVYAFAVISLMRSGSMSRSRKRS